MELKLTNIKKSFGTKDVLANVDFTFSKGKIYGLLGRNGAGKTTLFNCLSGEMTPDSGENDLVDGNVSLALSDADVGFVYSTPVLPDFLTGYEFIKFFMDINADKIENAKTLDEYFDMVKLDVDDRNRLIKGYSHGMKNKVQMLCFIITKPPVILLDEPLTSFDVIVALEMKNLLRSMKSEHIIIFSTHILQLATDLCDEIVVLHQGKLEAVDNDVLKSAEFEEKIIEILRDDETPRQNVLAKGRKS